MTHSETIFQPMFLTFERLQHSECNICLVYATCVRDQGRQGRCSRLVRRHRIASPRHRRLAFTYVTIGYLRGGVNLLAGEDKPFGPVEPLRPQHHILDIGRGFEVRALSRFAGGGGGNEISLSLLYPHFPVRSCNILN